jgi:hypothetical protein
MSESVVIRAIVTDDIGNSTRVKAPQAFAVRPQSTILVIDEAFAANALRVDHDFRMNFTAKPDPIKPNTASVFARHIESGNERRLKTNRVDYVGGVFDATAPARSGDYLLWMEAEDLFENIVKSQAVRVTFRASDVPVVVLKNTHDWDIIDGQALKGIFYELSGGDDTLVTESLTIELSDDGGKTWDYPLLPIQDVDGGKQVTMPRITTREAMVRVRIRNTSGAWGEDRSDNVFAIDSTTPMPRITSPSPLVTYDDVVTVEYTIDEEIISPIRRVQLWVTSDFGKTWFPETEAQGNPGVITLRPRKAGKYGLYVQAEKVNGLMTPPPLDGGTAPHYLFYKEEGELPRVEIIDFPPTDVVGLKGGKTYVIRWKAEGGQLIDRPVSIFLILPGSGERKVIKTDLEAVGAYEWAVGEFNDKHARVIVVARGEQGEGRAESAPFIIDSGDIKSKLRWGGDETSRSDRNGTTDASEKKTLHPMK